MNNYAFWAISRSGHSFVQNNVRSWMSNEEKFSAENWQIEKVFKNLDNETKLIVTIRDPFNNIASSMKHLFKNKKYPLSAMDLYIPRLLSCWCDMVKISLGEEKIGIPILYSDFRDSQEYRKKICNLVGGEYNEDFLNIVPPFGGYSSFDGNNYEHRGSEMNTDERWKVMLEGEHRDRYVSYFKEVPEVMTLCGEFFYKTESFKSMVKELATIV